MGEGFVKKPPIKLSEVLEMENTISFVRNFKGIDGWQQAEITEQESKIMQTQLRELNNRIYRESLKDSHEMLKPYIVPYSNSLPRIQELANSLSRKEQSAY